MRIIVLFLLFTLEVFSQFKITHYNSENGLPHDLCYQIIQDKQGFIWLGTDNGLVKFNGSAFQNFNRNQGLTNSFVIDVFEDGNKKIVATWGGGCYFFDGKQFSPITVKNSNFSKLQQILKKGNEIYSLENRVRINYYNIRTKKSKFYSLMTYNNKTFWYDNAIDFYKFYPNFTGQAKTENFQMEKIDNEVYCFTDKNSPQFKGVYKLDENFKTEYAFPFLNKFEIIGLQKYNSNYIATTPDAIIHFNKNGILKIDKSKFPSKRIIQFVRNPLFKVYLLQNKNNNEQEVFVEDFLTNKTTLFNASTLKSPVSDLLISKDNSIWISTYGNGLFLLQKPVIHIDKNILKGNYIVDFLEKKQFNFFITENTLIANHKTKNTFTKFPIQTIAFFKNRENDTICLVKKNGQKLLLKHESLIIKSIFIKNQITLNQQKIEYGDNELFYLNKGKREEIHLNVPDDERLFLKIKKMLFYENQYWVFTNNGIFILNKNFQQIKTIKQENGLLQNEIVNVSIYNRKLYILHYIGFSVFENQKITKHKFINNENDTFNDFVITPNGNLWFASQKGLLLFKNNLFYKFTTKEGLSSSFYSKIFLNTNKQLVALGNDGVDFLDANYEPFHALPHIILSEKANKNKPLQLENSINANQNFSIKAELVGYQNSKSVLEYKLNNQPWTILNANSYDFTNFSSGKYQIQFRAKYLFSDYTYTPIYIIKKEPVWYLRWYVLLPVTIAFLSFVTFLVFLRIKQLQKRNQKLQNLLESNEKLQFQLNEMRHNIAQDFHDELGNKLAGISVLSDKLLNDASLKSNNNYSVIERIYNDSQDLFSGIRDFIWAIDSKNGTLEELIFALTDFGENLFEHSNIKFIVNNNVENSAVLLPNFWNRQLLLLFKEAMTNAFKHSKASQLELTFTLNDNLLKIECTDNGIGFDVNKLSRKNGLLNLKKRAEKLNSQIVINSTSGTSVKFIGEII